MKARKRDEPMNIRPIHLIDHSFVSRLIDRYHWSINNRAPRSTMQFHKEGQAPQIQMVELSPRIEIKQVIQPLHVQLIYNSAQLLASVQAKVQALSSLLEQSQDIVKQDAIQTYRPNEPERRVINLPNSSESEGRQQAQQSNRRYIQAPQRHEVAPFSAHYPLLHRIEQSRVANWQLSANQQIMNKLSQRDWSMSMELLNNGQSNESSNTTSNAAGASTSSVSTGQGTGNSRADHKQSDQKSEREHHAERSESVVISRTVPRARVEMSWSKSVQQLFEEQQLIQQLFEEQQLIQQQAAQHLSQQAQEANERSSAAQAVRASVHASVRANDAAASSGNRSNQSEGEQLEGQAKFVRESVVQRKKAVLQSKQSKAEAVISQRETSQQGIQTTAQQPMIGQQHGMQTSLSMKQLLRGWQTSLRQEQQRLVIKKHSFGPLQLSYRVNESWDSLHERKVSHIHRTFDVDQNNGERKQGNATSPAANAQVRGAAQSNIQQQEKGKRKSTESNDPTAAFTSERQEKNSVVKLTGIRPLQRKQSIMNDDEEDKRHIQQSNKAEASKENNRKQLQPVDRENNQIDQDSQAVTEQFQAISNSNNDHSLKTRHAHFLMRAPISTSVANIAKLRSWQRKLNEQGETVVSQRSRIEQSSASSTMNIKLIHRKLTEQEQQQAAAFLMRRSEERRQYKEQAEQSKTEQSRKQNTEQAAASLNIRAARLVAAEIKEHSPSKAVRASKLDSRKLQQEQEIKQESLELTESRYKRQKHEVLSYYITSSKKLVERIQRQYSEAKMRQDVIVYHSQPTSFRLLGNNRKITVLDIAPLRLIGLTQPSSYDGLQASIADASSTAASVSSSVAKRLTLVDKTVQLAVRAGHSPDGAPLQASRTTLQAKQGNQAALQDAMASKALLADEAALPGASQAILRSTTSLAVQRQGMQERKQWKLFYRPMTIAAAQQEGSKFSDKLTSSSANQPLQRMLVRMRMLQTYIAPSPTMLQAIPLLHRQGNGQQGDGLQQGIDNILGGQQASAVADQQQKLYHWALQQLARQGNVQRQSDLQRQGDDRRQSDKQRQAVVWRQGDKQRQADVTRQGDVKRQGDGEQAQQHNVNVQRRIEVSLKLEHASPSVSLTAQLSNRIKQMGGMKRFAESVIRRTLPLLTSKVGKEVVKKATARKAIAPLDLITRAEHHANPDTISGGSTIHAAAQQHDEITPAAMQSADIWNISRSVLQHRAGVLSDSITSGMLQQGKPNHASEVQQKGQSNRALGVLQKDLSSRALGVLQNSLSSRALSMLQRSNRSRPLGMLHNHASGRFSNSSSNDTGLLTGRSHATVSASGFADVQLSVGPTAESSNVSHQTNSSNINISNGSGDSNRSTAYLQQRAGRSSAGHAPAQLIQSISGYKPTTLNTLDNRSQQVLSNIVPQLTTASASPVSAGLEITERRQPPARLDIRKEAVVQNAPQNVQQLEQTVQRLEQQLQEQQAVLQKQDKQGSTRQLVDQLYEELSRKIRMEAKRFGR